ncbi:hypothetical protein K6Y31_04310 [Motilimonas cestriensis]|uniref:Mobile element protein n=1 Tax=Motilimonas cestriensis TaxID=2742685 RepID=A0ABS8W9H1_9GAMM|nr:hypothetical protein [Motilimonas cestriensis]MCE2594035.1 hypothetical protein [Motilimonas cestriensis]
MSIELGGKMTNKKRVTFSAAIKLETTELVLDQGAHKKKPLSRWGR